ncbi:TonB-dependent receptor [Stieleria sp. JC731]|uniref:TonB-dependent receptor n=1 Tax=Stieleria sp. JC731 TaxID=2894195 RepID=UPI001E55155F|nr:TonB-dependent receptor [Stieleria sp. JC731]MCC9599372.1 TonB-dependent receptor [Stieleria sp. JC731]
MIVSVVVSIGASVNLTYAQEAAAQSEANLSKQAELASDQPSSQAETPLLGDGISADQLHSPVRPNGPVGANENASSEAANRREQKNAKPPLAADDRLSKLFGEVDQLDQLSEVRRPHAQSPAANAVFSAEAVGRRTSDVGSLLKQAKGAQGVTIQHRTPITSDTRVRGQRVGQILASGSYWAPARMDLDTMMSKIDSRLVEDLILIKGPYAARYGPSFRVVDLEFVHSPRYKSPEIHGSTSATYSSNGDHWYGRQSGWGGGEDYGFYLSYGHQTANDYETGEDGFFMPSSFKSRDVFLALGCDLSDHETIEFNYLRLDQTDVEIPGLVYDINYLVTDGYEVTYTNLAPAFFSDQFSAEFWYNRTRFEGDTSRPGKKQQIPSLLTELESPSGADGAATTDVDALSAGYRLESILETRSGQYAFGTDMIVLNQELNDIETFAPPHDNNYPIPRSHSIDVGLYFEDVERITDRLSMTAGGRVDGVFTDSEDQVKGVPIPLSDIKEAKLEQAFFLGAAYLTADYRLTPQWDINLGMGFASRAPTLTEMYAEASFIGSLQRGVTFLLGDPKLKQEKLYQLDAALRYSEGKNRFGAQTHYAWIEDFITYDLLDPPGTSDGFQKGAAFTNTDLAVLSGVELYGQRQCSDYITLFGTTTYTQGTDLTRREPARQSPFLDRSADPRGDEEPLPGINPLEARIGIVLEEPTPRPSWGIELMARIVDNQPRAARSLEEQPTAGFTTYDVRGYKAINQWLFTAGVENFTDKFYQEHIDYRAGRGVYRPGITAYVGTEVTY